MQEVYEGEEMPEVELLKAAIDRHAKEVAAAAMLHAAGHSSKDGAGGGGGAAGAGRPAMPLAYTRQKTVPSSQAVLRLGGRGAAYVPKSRTVAGATGMNTYSRC